MESLLRGPIGHESGTFHVIMYTCNGRCCEITDKNKCKLDKPGKGNNICCETVKFMLDKDSQSKVTYFDEIYFTICDSVEELVNDHLGLYAKFVRVCKRGE